MSTRMTITTKSLEQKISAAVEQVLREHLAECEAVTAAAVRGAFLRAAQPGAAKATKPASKEGPRRRRRPARVRTHEEVAALSERLYEAICAQPGETMSVLAKAMGSTPSELNLPARWLRRTGRLRSVGQRQFMRYFPTGE